MSFRYACFIHGIAQLIVLAAVVFVTCIVTVVTGGTALVTVPVMMMFGIPARVALATNMVTLTFMSAGGTLPFLRSAEIDRQRAPILIVLTAIGSAIGAGLVFFVPAELLPVIIPVAMIAVLAFLLINPRMGLSTAAAEPSPSKIRTGYVMVFLLGIYGGFFSGGYLTMLIAAAVFFFGYSFLQAIVMSRLMNIGSSLIATGVFAEHGAIPWPFALGLGCAAFAGALLGAQWARRVSEKVIRTVFLTTVAILALKPLIFDVPWRSFK